MTATSGRAPGSIVEGTAVTPPRIVAHRGASGVAPENTAAAIEAAIKAGADVVEIDVQRTRDGKLINFHDCTLDRVSDVGVMFPRSSDLRSADLSLEELRSLDVGGWFDESFRGTRIMTLDEVVSQVRGRIGLLVEVSPCPHYADSDLPDQIVAALMAIDGFVPAALEQDQLWIQSFIPEHARRVRELLPQAPVGLLTHARPDPEVIMDAAGWADQINPPVECVDEALVAAIHGAGLTLNCWTVNDAADLPRLRSLGVDGLITDHPERLVRLLTPTAS